VQAFCSWTGPGHLAFTTDHTAIAVIMIYRILKNNTNQIKSNQITLLNIMVPCSDTARGETVATTSQSDGSWCTMSVPPHRLACWQGGKATPQCHTHSCPGWKLAVTRLERWRRKASATNDCLYSFILLGHCAFHILFFFLAKVVYSSVPIISLISSLS
jgi:hypothetical protein